MRMAFRSPRASIGLGVPQEPEAGTAGAIAGEARRCRGGAGGMPEEGVPARAFPPPQPPRDGARQAQGAWRSPAPPSAPAVRPACRAFPCPPCLKSPCSPCAPQAPSVPSVFKRQRLRVSAHERSVMVSWPILGGGILRFSPTWNGKVGPFLPGTRENQSIS